MDHRVAYLAIALLVASAFALPAKAAESPVPVKVALTDMSSAMGMGPAGRGMMGHGMMSPGRGMMRGQAPAKAERDITGSRDDGAGHDDGHDGRSHQSAECEGRCLALRRDQLVAGYAA